MEGAAEMVAAAAEIVAVEVEMEGEIRERSAF